VLPKVLSFFSHNCQQRNTLETLYGHATGTVGVRPILYSIFRFNFKHFGCEAPLKRLLRTHIDTLSIELGSRVWVEIAKLYKTLAPARVGTVRLPQALMGQLAYHYTFENMPRCGWPAYRAWMAYIPSDLTGHICDMDSAA
jgi:hypothetical protein